MIQTVNMVSRFTVGGMGFRVVQVQGARTTPLFQIAIHVPSAAPGSAPRTKMHGSRLSVRSADGIGGAFPMRRRNGFRAIDYADPFPRTNAEKNFLDGLFSLS
jgi:hypothetical protein